MVDILFSKSSDPSYNLALEQCLLKNSNEDFLLLYINRPSIIFGRFQVPNAEINCNYVQHNNIPVFRRLSGGGTVVHDFGNLNYAFISKHQSNVNYYDFYNSVIISALESLDVKNIEIEDNNILCFGFKISGTAQYKIKKRLLHHGTLLIDSDLEFINKSLKKQDCYYGRMTPSRPMKVGNLKNYIDSSLCMQQIAEKIILALTEVIGGKQNNIFFEEDAIKKYQSELTSKEWIFGASPKYHFEKSFIFRNEKCFVSFNVNKGLVSNQMFSCKSLNNFNIDGKYHEISDVFSSLCICNDHLNDQEIQFLLSQMF